MNSLPPWKRMWISGFDPARAPGWVRRTGFPSPWLWRVSSGVARVDLVVLPEAGAFLALAVVSGELLYCDNSTEQAEYELYVLRRAGDLLPFERARRELILSQGAR